MRRTRLSLAAALAVATSVGVVAAPSVASAVPQEPIPVQLIAMNDFHGRISETKDADALQVTSPGLDGFYGVNPATGKSDDVSSTVGGSAHVAATVKKLQDTFRGQNGADAASVFVGAGDLISASTFESSVFKDEPTIEVLNAMGLDVSAVGNHEFDRGTDELRRVSGATDDVDGVEACPDTLGGKPFVPGTDGCFGTGEHEFHGAEFPYLAANVLDKATGEPMLPPYQVFEAGGGQKIALIGVVTETTPTIVALEGIADVEFIDEATAVNRVVPQLLKQGIKSIGVLVHEGGTQSGPTAPNPNGCDTLDGPIVDINNRMHDQVDLIVSAHTHSAYNCLLPVPDGTDRLVTSAGFYGRLVSDIRLMIKPTNGDVDRQATYQATNVPVLRSGTGDPTVAGIVQYWNDRSAVPGNRVVGELAAPLGKAGSANRATEQPIANVTAQSQLEALQSDKFGRPVIAFQNPGGVRANIDAGPVTYREVFEVQPFSNTINSITMTGADIKQALEEQFQANKAGPRDSQLILGTSEGFTYSYDLRLPYGSRVLPETVKLNGVVIDPLTSYRVAVNSFLMSGGDRFAAFAKGTDPVTGPLDVETLERFFVAHNPYTPPLANHSTQITG